MSENRAIIGAPSKDIGSKIDQGAAYVFEFSETIWLQQAKLISTDGRARDSFGFTVALSCGNALVATFYADNGTNSEKGSAYIFSMNGGWRETAKIIANNGLPNDSFGLYMAISDKNVVIAAPRVDGLGAFGNPNIGRVYMYRDERLLVNGFESDMSICLQ